MDQAQISRPTIKKSLWRFPVIDYTAHPIYRQPGAKTGFNDTIAALKQYWPDYFAGMYRYKENRKCIMKHAFLHKRSQAPSDLAEFEESGVLIRRIDQRFIEDLKNRLNEIIGFDMDTVDIDGQEVRRYIHFANEDPEIERLQFEMLNKHDFIEIAKHYTNAKTIDMAGWKIRIQQPNTEFKKNLFADVGQSVPETNYLHVDSSFPGSMLKMVLYLGEVNGSNGPFCYVPGSHRLNEPIWRVIARRVNHKSGIQSWDPETRERFMRLPAFFRHKAEFGNDILPNSELAQTLLKHEIQVTSDVGNFILFDNSGMHRGGLVEQGRRVCLQWTMNALG